LRLGSYAVTVRDTARAAANNAPIDGDGDGVAGGSATVTVEHGCEADLRAGFGVLDLSDIDAFITSFSTMCGPAGP